MKQNIVPSAGTKAQQRTDVEDTNVSPFFAKPHVGRSLSESIEIIIKIFEERKNLFGAEIFINGAWFKEITGLPTKGHVIKAISENEDLLNSIKNNNYD